MTLRDLLQELLQAAQDRDWPRIVDVLADGVLDAQLGTLASIGGWMLGVVVAFACGRWLFDFALAMAEGPSEEPLRDDRASRAGRLARRSLRRWSGAPPDD